MLLPEDDSSPRKKNDINPEQITTREELMNYRKNRDALDKDTIYNEKQKRKLEKSSDIQLTSSINVQITEKEPYWNDEPLSDKPKTLSLEKESGYETYKVQYDGIVEICFQSLTASSLSPKRLHVRISDVPPKHIRKNVSTSKLKKGLQVIADQTDGMIIDVQQILRDSDMLKDFEQDVRGSNTKLYKATLLWPCIRIGLFIVIMGFGSSFYLIGLFRKHGLIQ